ncbi:esterase [Croceivirga lutea]|uniref:alpha/beta hydrolase n=1 Tax=Croceivirga lutea TaxID=1775167 RepID=UPI001639D2F2|nr:esterase [Croceivirga lutea]GGG43688.1 esterase [Croceivirga lutea]
MQQVIKQVSYTTTNTYETLNELTKNTTHIWIVLHGIGYLSKYFLRHFKSLPSDKHYIIAPQAPSKYYLKDEYKYVGASWLTKENTEKEILNVLAYLEAVLIKENLPKDKKLVLFGFSQGVSIATRWVARRKLVIDYLFLYAGGIPNELKADDFLHLKNKTTVKVIYGNEDVFLNEERLVGETKKIKNFFPNETEIIKFDGGHEMKPEIINALLK